jgi:hypothetical protein
MILGETLSNSPLRSLPKRAQRSKLTFCSASRPPLAFSVPCILMCMRCYAGTWRSEARRKGLSSSDRAILPIACAASPSAIAWPATAAALVSPFTRYIILSGVISVLHPLAVSKGPVSDALPPKNFSLNAGAAFGEAALKDSTRRSSTCCAETDVELLVVPKDAYVQLHSIAVLISPTHRLCSILFCCAWLTSRVASYTRLIQQTHRDGIALNSEFLQSGQSRAAIIKVVVSRNMQYVAAADAWGYICVWNHAIIADGIARKDQDQRKALVARWKVSEEVLDVQFIEENGTILLLLLLPPVPPSVANVPSLFALDSSPGETDGCTGQLLASWLPHPSIAKDCLCLVNSPPPLSETARAGQASEAHGECEEGELGHADECAAAPLAVHINSIVSVIALSLIPCF